MVLSEGEVLDGKYQVERILGEGGMGYVVAAWHSQLEQRVALKLLRPETLADASCVTRFHREAKAAAKIKSEHVCRVIDVGLSAAHGPYMVMEYLEGRDLQSLMREVGPRPIPQAVTWILHACHAIAEAHGRNIVHRDLKPANLFLADRPDGEPIVKVLDFGISKVIDDRSGAVQANLTTTSMFMGSYAYMSPEQARTAKDLDGRADIWALGAILQKLVTGATPFVAEAPSAYVAKIVADPPARLRDRRPDAPPELEAVVLRCLEKDRDNRFPNVAELARALSPFAPGSDALVRAIVRICWGSLEPERPSAAGEPAALPRASSRGLETTPSPGPTPRGQELSAQSEALESAGTPTKPMGFAAAAAALFPPQNPAGTPVPAGGMTPTPGAGQAPALAPAPMLAGLPAFFPLAAFPPPAPGATPAGIAATPGTVAPWTPGPVVPPQPRSGRKAQWTAIVGATIVVAGAAVLWIAVAATSQGPSQAGATSGPSIAPQAQADHAPDALAPTGGDPAKSASQDGGAQGTAASASAQSASASATSSASSVPGAASATTESPKPKPRPDSKWDPFAHP